MRYAAFRGLLMCLDRRVDARLPRCEAVGVLTVLSGVIIHTEAPAAVTRGRYLACLLSPMLLLPGARQALANGCAERGSSAFGFAVFRRPGISTRARRCQTTLVHGHAVDSLSIKGADLHRRGRVLDLGFIAPLYVMGGSLQGRSNCLGCGVVAPVAVGPRWS